MKRDEIIANDISSAEDNVQKLSDRLLEVMNQAEGQGATAHADLYEHVLGCLASAQKQLRRAHEVMLNADPVDYTRSSS